MIITRISDGPISRWNEEHPHCRVRQRDNIVEVNNIRGEMSAMIEQFRRGTNIRMLLRRESEYAVVVAGSSGLGNFTDLKAGLTIVGINSILDDLIRRWNDQNRHLQISGCDRIV